MLPFKPESLEALQARYPLSMVKVFDVRAILGGEERPGRNRANVFDFEDGFRLIASRELVNGSEFFHFAGGMTSGFETGKPQSEYVDVVVQRIAALTGGLPQTLGQVVTSEEAIHIVYPTMPPICRN